MSDEKRKPRLVLGSIAAAIGGGLGYLIFFWMVRQGLYGMIIPPALLGLAAGFVVGARSQPFAIMCGIAGLALGVFCEWKFAPFIADKSLAYFLTHLHQLKPFTLILLVIGTIASYRLALGFDRPAS